MRVQISLFFEERAGQFVGERLNSPRSHGEHRGNSFVSLRVLRDSVVRCFASVGGLAAWQEDIALKSQIEHLPLVQTDVAACQKARTGSKSSADASANGCA